MRIGPSEAFTRAEPAPGQGQKHLLQRVGLGCLSRPREQRQEGLEREIARGPEPQPLLHPNLAELYRQKVAELHTALEHPTHAAEAVEKIRALIDAIVLTPEEGKLRVDLTGTLAGILSVAQKDQRPRPEDEAHASHVKLVAGAGFTAFAGARR